MNEEEREEVARASRNARRLLDDELFMAAVESIRKEAYEKLILADANDPVAIVRAQESVKLCEKLIGELTSKMDLAAINNRTGRPA